MPSTASPFVPPTPYERNLQDAAAIKRIARELRLWLESAPKDDPDVAGILKDCEALDRAVQLLSTKPITVSTVPGDQRNRLAAVQEQVGEGQ